MEPKNSDITPNMLESRGSFTEDTKFIGNEDIEPTSGDDTLGAADKELQDPLEDINEGPKHVTGYKLLFAMAALNLSAILINLDNAILSTVRKSEHSLSNSHIANGAQRQPLLLPMSFTLSKILAGT